MKIRCGQLKPDFLSVELEMILLLILLNDSIKMKPPYEITQHFKNHNSISEKTGAVNATYLNKLSPKLRKENKNKTIHSSLKIEGNTLTGIEDRDGNCFVRQ